MRRESGQALVFASFTLFFLAATGVMVFNVGQVSAERLRVQHAADLAAYSGAMVYADIVSDIAWLNEGAAYLYYDGMRYAVDDVVYGVLAELKDHPPVTPSNETVTYGGAWDPRNRYDNTYADAAEWIPRLERWMQKIEHAEMGLAASGHALVRKEVFRAALTALGVDPDTGDPERVQVAIFPEIEMVPDPEGYFLLTITRILNGWRIETDDGWWFEVSILGPDHWRVDTSGGDWFEVQRIDDDTYEVTTLTTDADGNPVVVTWTYQRLGDDGWIASGPGGTFTLEPGPNGGTIVTWQDNDPMEVRRAPGGDLEYWDDDLGEWMPTGPDSVTIDGVEVPVQSGPLVIGNTQIDFDPLRFWIDRFEIIPTDDTFVITGSVGPARVRIDGDYVVVNGLSNRNADGLWYRYGDDRTRHRMTETSSDTEWEYEWRRSGTMLQWEMNRERLGIVHAIRDNDPVWAATGALPDWAFHGADNPDGWFDPTRGAAVSDLTYHQTRLCWHPSDNNCPVHGPGCGGNGAGYPDPAYDGGWHEPAIGGAWVECPTCLGMDNDNDVRTDVRKYQRDAADRNDPPHQSVAVPRVLVLDEAFFQFGLNVGVWFRPTPPLLDTVFDNPESGYFAIASARCGFRDPVTDRFRYKFGSNIEREDWIEFAPENLYVMEWEAKLFPVVRTVRREDIDGSVDDTGIGYLLRGFRQTAWYDTFEDRTPDWATNGRIGNLVDRLGRRFDPSGDDEELEDVFRH